MFTFIKRIFITFGLACGMTAASLTYQSQTDRCRAVVLLDLSKHAQFQAQLAGYNDQPDFLTALTRKR